MWRLAFMLVILAAGALGGQARAAKQPPILYISGEECPANQNCTGMQQYNDRIFEIVDPGLPGHLLSNPFYSDEHPAWSPDFKRIAFVREGPQGTSYNVWLMNADTTGQTKLTTAHTGVDTEPTWSPDGSRIVFRGNTPNGKSFDLYSIKTDGTGLTDLTSNPDNVSVTNPDWSPNGKRIVFQRTNYNSGAGTGIFVINPDGSGLKRLVIGGQDPAWSPNGKKIAYIDTDPASGGVFEIYVMNADGSGKTKLTSGAESVAPAWSPSGANIVFVRGNQVALMHPDGSGIKQLTPPLQGSKFVDTPDW